MVLGLKIDKGEKFERAARGGDAAARARRPVRVLHRRHQRGDERRRGLFGEERLGALVAEHARPAVRRAARAHPARGRSAFVGDAAQHDDMTMILLKVEPTAFERAVDVRRGFGGRRLADADAAVDRSCRSI